MFRAFLKDSAIYSVGGILARAISLILLPFYTRVLSPREYGVIDLLTVFGALVNFVVALEISQGLARHLPESTSEEDRAEWASTAFWFTTAALTLFSVVCFVFARPFSRMLLDSDGLAAVFRLAVVSIALNGIFYLGQMQLRWQLQPHLYTMASLAFTVVSIGSTVFFVLQLRLGVTGVILGQIAGFLTGAATTMWFARRNYRFLFSAAKCRAMLAFSIPLVPSSIGVFVAAYIDRIAIKHLMQIDDVGIYGVGYRLASPVALMTMGFQSAMTPLVVHNYKDPQTPSVIARIFRYFVVMALLSCVTLSLFAREVIAIFAAPNFAAAARLVPLLAPAVLLPTMVIFAPGLFVAKKTRVQASVMMMTAALNTVLNFALIPFLGTSGSALATLLSAGAGFIVFMALSQREYHVPHHWRAIVLAAGAAAALIALAGLVPMPTPFDARAVALHALLAAAAAVCLPPLVLGRDEVKLIGGKTKALLLARARS